MMTSRKESSTLIPKSRMCIHTSRERKTLITALKVGNITWERKLELIEVLDDF
jgi:hypothetical protein